MRPALETPASESRTTPNPAANERFIPRDRYDAELFNREYHGKP
jgi:hypothetical protein